ncbi:MAG: hypothetical protein ACXW3L_09960 [Limisphaerales bacterium]
MAARSLKQARIIPKADLRHTQTVPSPFPLLVLVLIIMLIFLVRLRAEEQSSVHPVAMRAALPETIQ